MITNGMEKFRDEVAFSSFGRSRVLALAGNQCVKCGGSVVLSKDGGLDFRDELSEKEYGISALCQGCQDKFYGV